jgi:RNA polymerase sigma-70 factor (ECF subfamily)
MDSSFIQEKKIEVKGLESRRQEQVRDFEQIVEDYITDVKKIIFVYVKNYHAMEDITQEVFLSIYNNLSEFRGESPMKVWIFKIAINKSKDYLKSWHYRKVYLTSLFKEETSKDDVEKTTISNIQSQKLSEIIMNLPIKYKEIIILYYYQDLDTTQISSILNLSVNTVKTRLIRGREIIKRRFDY